MTRPQNPIPPYQLTNKVARVWVTSVPDGDSLWVALSPNRGERTYPVRLFGIDAPERDQAYGRQAQWELRKLVERHTEGLLMEVLDVDRYNRLVALLYFPSADRYRSINRIMVEQGHAYWFRAFGALRDWASQPARRRPGPPPRLVETSGQHEAVGLSEISEADDGSAKPAERLALGAGCA